MFSEAELKREVARQCQDADDDEVELAAKEMVQKIVEARTLFVTRKRVERCRKAKPAQKPSQNSPSKKKQKEEELGETPTKKHKTDSAAEDESSKKQKLAQVVQEESSKKQKLASAAEEKSSQKEEIAKIAPPNKTAPSPKQIVEVAFWDFEKHDAYVQRCGKRVYSGGNLVQLQPKKGGGSQVGASIGETTVGIQGVWWEVVNNTKPGTSPPMCRTTKSKVKKALKDRLHQLR